LTNLVHDLEVGTVPLIRKSVNNRNDHGENRECFVIDSLSKTPTHAEMFRFLGVLIGYSFRSKSCMPFNLAPVFWKQLIDEQLTETDLKGFDTYSWQVIQDLRKHAKELDETSFEYAVDQNFTTVLSNGQVVDLCEGGKDMRVTKDNYEKFIQLMLQKRFEEGKEQMAWIKDGVRLIIDMNIMSMLNWEEVEVRSAGEKIVDIAVLKSITEYHSCSASDKIIEMFWKVMESFTEEEKQKYLKFVWGRQRLPSDCSQLRNKHTIQFESDRGDASLPVSHTCFFTIDLPNYSTEEIMKKKLKIAMEFCGEIDGDWSVNQDYEDVDVAQD
jgi:E3 ubiquitin-protein ligase HERC2